MGEIVNLDPEWVGMLGFGQDETERYVGEMFDAYGFDPAKKPVVLADLESFYAGYTFVSAQPGGPLNNSTICNRYLNKFVKGRGTITPLVIDTNVRTDIRWNFVPACASLMKGERSWREVFAVWWDHYVKAHNPAQAFDKMNENFFRTTFASRCMDAMPMRYSVWSEFNVAAGRIDFLASPKPGKWEPATSDHRFFKVKVSILP